MKRLCHRLRMTRKTRVIYNELKRFGDQTSAKGVGRAIKAEGQCLKVMWIIAVIFLLCITIYNVFNLTIEFTQYNTGTKITERKIDIEDTGTDVLICNINPYSTVFLNETIEKRDGYRKLVTEWTSVSCTEQQQQHQTISSSETSLIREEIRSLTGIRQELLEGNSGFYQHIGIEEASHLSHIWKNVILSCQIYFLDGVLEKSIPCSYTKLKVRNYRHKDYFNCYKIYGENNRGSRPSTGMSFLMFIDNVQDRDVKDNDITIRGRGAVLTIGDRGTFLNPNTGGVYILPKHVNTIRFKPIHRKRLPKPHGDCLDIYNQEVVKQVLGNGFNFPYLYTEEACLSACIEYKIIEACSCQDVGQYGILLDVFRNVSMCGASNQGKDVLLERMKCAQKWRSTFRKQCLLKCPSPCEERLFDKSVNYLEIAPGQLKDNLEKEKQSSSVPNLYGEEQVIDPPYDDLNTSHFAWVYVKRDRTSYFQVKDTVGMTVSDWLAKVGGAMNLWSGITVFVFVEIVDFLCRLVSSMFSTKMEMKKLPKGPVSLGSCHCECHCSCDKESKGKFEFTEDRDKQTCGNVNPSVK